MIGNIMGWVRTLSDPLSSANRAGRWIDQLPAQEAIAIQREALELVSGFPGARKEPGPGQVEALLRIDARIEPVIAQLIILLLDATVIYTFPSFQYFSSNLALLRRRSIRHPGEGRGPVR